MTRRAARPSAVDRSTAAAGGVRPTGALERGSPRERGSASVLVVGAAGAVVVVLTAALVLTGVVRDVHRAGAAADLAALAAAVPLAEGGEADCAAASAVAASNGAVMSACAAQEGAVRVSVALRLRGQVDVLGVTHATGAATAGLVPDDP